MKYKCLKSKGRADLTVGKVYEVTHADSDGDHVIVADDGGNFYIKPGDLDNIWATWEFIDKATYTQRIARIKEELAQIEQLQDTHVDDQLMLQITKLDIPVPTLVEELETMWDLRNIFQGKGWSTNQIKGFADWLDDSQYGGCEVREYMEAVCDWRNLMNNDPSDVEDAWEFYNQFEREERDWLNENDVSHIKETVEEIVSLAKAL